MEAVLRSFTMNRLRLAAAVSLLAAGLPVAWSRSACIMTVDDWKQYYGSYFRNRDTMNTLKFREWEQGLISRCPSNDDLIETSGHLCDIGSDGGRFILLMSLDESQARKNSCTLGTTMAHLAPAYQKADIIDINRGQAITLRGQVKRFSPDSASLSLEGTMIVSVDGAPWKIPSTGVRDQDQSASGDAEPWASLHRAAEDEKRQQRAKHMEEVKHRQEEAAGAPRRAEAARGDELRAAMEEEQSTRELSRYRTLIDQKIRRSWLMPGEQRNRRCTLKVQLAPGGDVLDVQLVTSSGETVFDDSAQKAVLRASPLPVPSGRMFDQFRTFTLIFDPTPG